MLLVTALIALSARSDFPIHLKKKWGVEFQSSANPVVCGFSFPKLYLRCIQNKVHVDIIFVYKEGTYE